MKVPQNGILEYWNVECWSSSPCLRAIPRFPHSRYSNVRVCSLYHKWERDEKSLFFKQKDCPFQRGKGEVESDCFLQSITGLLFFSQRSESPPLSDHLSWPRRLLPFSEKDCSTGERLKIGKGPRNNPIKPAFHLPEDFSFLNTTMNGFYSLQAKPSNDMPLKINLLTNGVDERDFQSRICQFKRNSRETRP